MKKLIASKKHQETISEKDVSDLKVKKLTLKTGVKAGVIGGGGGLDVSCCPRTCHTN